jgi:hypothetical protein
MAANIGMCKGCGFGCSLSCILGLGFGCCFGSRRSTNPSSHVVSTCWEAPSPPQSVLAVSSLSLSLSCGPCATPFMVWTIMVVSPAPHTLPSSPRLCHFCSLSCIHVIIGSACASMRSARVSTRFARCRGVQCSCLSYSGCCRIILPMRLFQSLGSFGASLLHLCFPFSFLTIVSHVSFARSLRATVTISITISIGASLLTFPAAPACNSLVLLTLNLFITSARQAS